MPVTVSSLLQVFVLSLGDYLQTFWTGLTPALQLYKSIQQAAAAPQEVTYSSAFRGNRISWRVGIQFLSV